MRIAYGNTVSVCFCCYRWKVRLEFHSIILVVWCLSLTYRLLKRLDKMFKKKWLNFMTVACLWVCVCVKMCESVWERDDCMILMTDDHWPMTVWLMKRLHVLLFCFWFYNIYTYRWINVSLSFSFFTLFCILYSYSLSHWGIWALQHFLFCFGLHSLHYH